MLKSKVINEGAQTGLYTSEGARGWKGCPREFPCGWGTDAAGTDWWKWTRMDGEGKDEWVRRGHGKR
jgi:hypothetical protein